MEKVKSICEKVLTWVKANYKIVIAVVVALLVVCVAFNFLNGKNRAKNAVKSYVAAINKADEKKIMKKIDVKGAYAWEKCNQKVKKFKDEYSDVEKSDVEDYEEKLEKTLETFCDELKKLDKYSMKVVEIKDVEKEASGLYKVTAKVKIKVEDDDDEHESTDKYTFYVYKGKIISGGGILQ